jgi:hypothetical protein
MGTVQPVWPRFRPLAAHKTVDSSSKVTSAEETSAPETDERFFKAVKSPMPPSVAGGGRAMSSPKAERLSKAKVPKTRAKKVKIEIEYL